MSVNTGKILEQLKAIEITTPRRAINDKEKQIAQTIVELIKKLEQSATFDIIEDDELYPVESEEDIDVEITFEPLVAPSNDFFSYDYIKKVIDYKDSTLNPSFKSVQHMFRRVKHDSYLKRFRQYLNSMGTAREKYFSISKFVWDRYQEARKALAAVHDRDLKRWGLMKAREIELTGFKASDWWINEFKRKNKIGSRKVTNFVTYKHEVNQTEIEAMSADFLLKFNEQIKPDFEPGQIFNSDQSGYQYEMHRDRTLSNIGERVTSVAIVSSRAVSHSYTIQPLLSMDGQLAKNLMIVFQESQGQFGPIVQSKLVHPPHVFITCTKSGKVEVQTLKDWVSNCFAPNIEEKACLIVDSFGTHKKGDIFNIQDKEVTVRILPPGSTSILQPFDVLIFRQWKYFVKNFSERVILDQLPVDLHDRNTIITLHYLILNQLRAPLFKPLLLNSWARSGFPVEKSFYNTFKESIFDVSDTNCSNDSCVYSAFLLCAYCKKNLCIRHFYADKHHHDD